MIPQTRGRRPSLRTVRDSLLPGGYDSLDAHGSVVHVRPVHACDQAPLTALFHHLSLRSRYRRFLGASVQVADNYVARILTGEATLDAVMVLHDGRVAAVGSTHPVTRQSAEFALLVEDSAQATGIGTLLLEDLVGRTLARGMHEMCAEALQTNGQVLDLLRHLGPPTQLVASGDALSVRVGLDHLSAYRRAVAQRDLRARGRSVSAVRGRAVRGREKVPTGGQVEVPAGGQMEVPALRVVS